jgi:CO/xanthine dehydrogenase FAD-binding subunit
MGTTRILKKFEYFKPKTLSEAILMFNQKNDEGNNISIIAGGTNILIDIKRSRISIDKLIDISDLAELREIEIIGDRIRIGAAVTVKELEKSAVIKENFFALFEAAQSMATTQIKNSATIAGNICNASPAADLALPLSIFGSDVEIVNKEGTKLISLNDFFTGYKKTALKSGEIVKAFNIPIPGKITGSAFLRLTRTSSDLSQVSVAVMVTVKEDIIESANLAMGAVSPLPALTIRLQDKFKNRKISKELISEIERLVSESISPITDVRATGEYRKEVSGILAGRALKKAYERTINQEVFNEE